jgi:hypothetical protein
MAYESFGETTCVILRESAISERLDFFRKQFGGLSVIVGYISFGKQDHKFRVLCTFIFVVCDEY